MILTASAIRAAQEVDLPRQCGTSFVNDLAFPILGEYLKWKAYLQRCTHVPFHGGTKSVQSFYDGLAGSSGTDGSNDPANPSAGGQGVMEPAERTVATAILASRAKRCVFG